jgi:hypothetical protein
VISGSISGSTGQVRAGTTSGENTTDRVWAVRRPRSGEAWGRKAGDLYISGLHALLREAPELMERSRKTAKKRMVAKLHAIKAELRHPMHEPVADVGAWLRKVVTGYYRYHAVPGNIERLSVFGQRLRRLWWLTLRRRSQRPVAWDRLLPIFTRWLPSPRVLHPYPVVRFLATHPRWEPYA